MFERFTNPPGEQSKTHGTRRCVAGTGADHLLLALLDRNDPDPMAAPCAAAAVDRIVVSERLSTRDRS